MMNPGTFEWAKKFLTSPVWATLATASSNTLSFSLPKACPVTSSPTCFIGQGNEVITMVEDSFSAEFHAEDQPLGDPEPSSPTTPSSEVDLRDVSPSTGPWAAALLAKAGKLKLSEEDPALRRSIRQKGQKKGYRHKSCLDKHCVACESKPPTISPLVIKNLGASFCDIDPAKLTDQALSKKKKAVAPMGKKPAPKKNSRDKDDVAKDKAAAAKKKAKK